jgi:hypothetical protein
MISSIQELNDGMNEACALPNGSRFFRCALQVNSFPYLERHGKETTGFADEDAFNSAMVDACKEHDIEVFAVTDHFRIDTARTLIKALRDAGITVFPGSEAASSDLDNRFVVEDIVPQIRGGKGHRQLVFATHNANIPVLGDADLILGFSARGDAAAGSEGRGKIEDGHRGSIDQASVGQLVKEILEGGKTAFETRRAKCGF